jgi:hypothetical protein
MDDVRERARIKREMAAHIRQIIPGLSAKEDRELLEKQVKTLEAEAIELERQAASAGTPPAVSTMVPPPVPPAPAPPVQAVPPPRGQVAPLPEAKPPAAKTRKARAKPSSPAAPGKPKTRRR